METRSVGLDNKPQEPEYSFGYSSPSTKEERQRGNSTCQINGRLYQRGNNPLGQGKSGVVYPLQPIEKNSSSEQGWVVKSGGIKEEEKPALEREVEYFGKIYGGTHLVLLPQEEDNYSYRIVMKEIPGKTLFDYIQALNADKRTPIDSKRQLYDEATLAAILALQKIHAEGIAHGDYHLNNIVIQKNEDGTLLAKSIDFGQSCELKKCPSVWDLANLPTPHCLTKLNPPQEKITKAWQQYLNEKKEAKEESQTSHFSPIMTSCATVEEYVTHIKNALYIAYYKDILAQSAHLFQTGPKDAISTDKLASICKTALQGKCHVHDWKPWEDRVFLGWVQKDLPIFNKIASHKRLVTATSISSAGTGLIGGGLFLASVLLTNPPGWFFTAAIVAAGAAALLTAATIYLALKACRYNNHRFFTKDAAATNNSNSPQTANPLIPNHS